MIVVPEATRDQGAVHGLTNDHDLTVGLGDPGVNPVEVGALAADLGLGPGGPTREEVPARCHVPKDLAHVTERNQGPSLCVTDLVRGAPIRSIVPSSCHLIR